MKTPDLRISGRADVAVVALTASRPRLPDVRVELTPSAAREAIRLLERATTVAEGQAYNATNGAGEVVSRTESMGALLSAFVGTGAVR